MALSKVDQIKRVLYVISRNYSPFRLPGMKNFTRQAVPECGSSKPKLREAEKEKNVYWSTWMKDPATGNWVPETHFGETKVAELREKVLSKKQNL